MYRYAYMPLEEGDVDLRDLVSRLKKGGSLSRGELQSVRKRLAEAVQGDDLYNLARALGLGAPASSENVELLEPLLMAPATDDWGLHGVINALCIDWGLGANYLDRLLVLAGPRLWESHQSAAIAALSAIGGYLRKNDDRPTIGTLLQYLECASRSSGTGKPASLHEYSNQVWGALDQWLRGRDALVQPTRFDPNSESYRRVLARFRALH